ncbi:MAG: hypothetical protein ACTSRR_13435 [Candidatus Heimdallarchaeaceae archaeon]
MSKMILSQVENILQYEQPDEISPALSRNHYIFIEKLIKFLSNSINYPSLCETRRVFFSNLLVITALNNESKYLTKNFLTSAFLALLRNVSGHIDAKSLQDLINQISGTFIGVSKGKAFSLSSVNKITNELINLGIIKKSTVDFFTNVEKEALKLAKITCSHFEEIRNMSKNVSIKISSLVKKRIVPRMKVKQSSTVLVLSILFNYLPRKGYYRDNVFKFVSEKQKVDFQLLKKRVYRFRSKFNIS